MGEMSSTDGIYHERQSLQLCALHSLNNLLQRKNAVTKQQLDAICKEFAPDNWINPHKSMLGLGNYDVNILMTALHNNDYETVWFDRRKEISCIRPDSIFGYIINVPSKQGLLSGLKSLLFSDKHWFAVRKLKGRYYNLDSKLSMPQPIGDSDQELIEFLSKQLSAGSEAQLLLVVTAEVHQAGSWQSAGS